MPLCETERGITITCEEIAEYAPGLTEKITRYVAKRTIQEGKRVVKPKAICELLLKGLGE